MASLARKPCWGQVGMGQDVPRGHGVGVGCPPMGRVGREGKTSCASRSVFNAPRSGNRAKPPADAWWGWAQRGEQPGSPVICLPSPLCRSEAAASLGPFATPLHPTAFRAVASRRRMHLLGLGPAVPEPPSLPPPRALVLHNSLMPPWDPAQEKRSDRKASPMDRDTRSAGLHLLEAGPAASEGK